MVNHTTTYGLRAEDVRIDVFTSGPANRPMHAVRATHLPTGMVTDGGVDQSQLASRERALRSLGRKVSSYLQAKAEGRAR